MPLLTTCVDFLSTRKVTQLLVLSSTFRRSLSVSSTQDDAIPIPPESKHHTEPTKYSRTFAPRESNMLTRALEPYLPRLPDPYDEMPVSKQTRRLTQRPGYHFLVSQDDSLETALFPEGTEVDSAPGPDWPYRVWYGGSFRYEPPVALLLPYSSRTLSWRQQDESFKEGSRCLVRYSDLITIYSGSEPPKQNKVTQQRMLSFSKVPPASFSAQNLSRGRPPPTGATFRHKLVPTSTLLFRYSALTYNAHKIHIDVDFARDVYKAPNLVVHGPLSLTLLLQVVTRACYKARTQDGLHAPVFESVTYKNTAPLFVNEEMVICCKKLGVHNRGARDEVWEAWIQKDVAGVTIMAVHATVNFFSPQFSFNLPVQRIKVPEHAEEGNESSHETQPSV